MHRAERGYDERMGAESRSRSGCPLCESEHRSFVLKKRSPIPAMPTLEVLRCQDCDHCYLGRWRETLQLGLYDYYADRLGRSREQLYLPLNTRSYESMLAGLEGEVRGRRLLDVGCGMGHLVYVAQARGWDALGIDTSGAAVRLARELGAQAIERDFFSDELSDARFDAVVLSELIEHVPDPGRFLRRAAMLLAPGGTLYLTTPNFDSLTRRLVGSAWSPIHPEHISYFVESRLRRALVDAGLRVKSLTSRNTSPVEIFRALAKRSQRVAAPTATAPTPRNPAAPAAPNPTQALRQLVMGSASLRGLHQVANRGLGATCLGDTLVAYATR